MMCRVLMAQWMTRWPSERRMFSAVAAMRPVLSAVWAMRRVARQVMPMGFSIITSSPLSMHAQPTTWWSPWGVAMSAALATLAASSFS